MASSNAVLSDQAQAIRDRESEEVAALRKQVEELQDGPSKEALEEILAGAEAFLAGFQKYRTVSAAGMGLRPGYRASELGMPTGQEEWLGKVAKEVEGVVLRDLQHPLPKLDRLAGPMV